jgi:hypothetical protein
MWGYLCWYNLRNSYKQKVLSKKGDTDYNNSVPPF